MLKKLSALIPVIVISISLFGLIWLFFSLIAVKEKNIHSVLENEKAVVERVVSDNFNHTLAIAESMNSQIKNNVGNKKYINEILTRYKTSPNLVDTFSWTIFSWVDNKNQLTVDAQHSILKTPIDLSNRDYLKSLSKTNELIIGRPVIGSTSKKWMIPAGVNLLDKNRQYLGSMTIGFEIDGLAKIIQKSIKNNNVKFVLFFNNIPVLEVRKSSFRSFRNNESLETEPDLAKFKEMKGVQEVNVLLNPKAFHVAKFKEYSSLKIVAEYDKTAIKKELLSGLLSRILEGFFIISTAGTILFLLYRKEKLQSKIFLDLKNIAEEANKSKEFLIHTMSHDIKNYVFKINNLSHEVCAEKEKLQNLEAIKLESEELSNFVEDLLNPDQQRTGILKVGRRTNLDLAKFFDDLHFLHSYYLKEQKVTLKIDLPENLVPLPCDKRRFKQIMMNLLGNAAKYSNEGGLVTISADLCDENYQIIPRENFLNLDQKNYDSAKVMNGPRDKHGVTNLGDEVTNQGFSAVIPSNDRVHTNNQSLTFAKFMLVSISDTGIGMTQEEIKMMLNGDGYNIEKTGLNKPIDSHGIGMKTVMQLVKGHNAKMEVESQKNLGTTFKLFFPLDVEVFDATNAKETKTINILIVDDQKVNLLATKSLLEKEMKNIVCKTANSADEALKIIKEQDKLNFKFDLILTDIQMPKTDGFELAKIIRKSDEKTPIIAYSSTISDNMVEKTHAEIDQFLTKPIDDKLLIKTIAKWNMIDQQYLIQEEEWQIMHGKKILFADDEELNLKLLSRILEQNQMIIETAKNGEELYEKYKNNKGDFDIILTDLKMPILNGFEAAKKIRDYEISQNFYHKTPVIAYSGDKSLESFHEAFRSGIDDYYVKGENKNKLLEMIAFWLEFNDKRQKFSSLQETKVEISSRYFNENEFIDDELINIFNRDAKRLIDEIIKAKETKDIKQFNFSSHALKGICGVMKVQDLFDHVSYINSLAKQNHFPSDQQLKNLITLFRSAKKSLG